MVGTVELVALAIQAGIGLARAGRQIYVEDTISREITIPLPAGFQSSIGDARRWVEKLEAKGDPRFARVYAETFNEEVRRRQSAEAEPP
jgi:hypothetical protein